MESIKENQNNINWLKRASSSQLNVNELIDRKNAIKNELANEDIDQSKIKLIANVLKGIFDEETSTLMKMNVHFSKLKHLVELDTKNPNQKLGMQFLKMFAEHYLTAPSFDNLKANTSGVKREEELTDEEKATIQKRKETTAAKTLQQKTVSFLIETLVRNHFAAADKAEREEPVEAETKELIEKARMILKSIEDETVFNLDGDKNKRFSEFLQKANVSSTLVSEPQKDNPLKDSNCFFIAEQKNEDQYNEIFKLFDELNSEDSNFEEKVEMITKMVNKKIIKKIIDE